MKQVKMPELRAVLQALSVLPRLLAEIPPGLYPPQWVERAEALDAGTAQPRDWEAAL